MKKFKALKIIGIIVAALVLFWTVINVIPPKKNVESNPFIVEKGSLPMIAAHRGGGVSNPENTMLAFREAVKTFKVDIIESDLYLTKDGYLVYNHDAYIDETCNVNGEMTLDEVEELCRDKSKRHYIKDMTLAELEKYNFGYYFENKDGEYIYRDVEDPAAYGLQIATVDKLFEEFYEAAEKGKAYSTLEMCNKIGEQPLCAQPGEVWNYGTSADIAGGIIEAVSGKSFGEFLKEEIFAPLGMTDTDFYVPENKRDRFAEIYIRDEKGKLNICEWQHLGLTGKYTAPPSFEIGGCGLVSTVDDYAKFAQMLLNKGEYKGVRILSPSAVSRITTDNLTEGQKKTFNWDSCYGYGYGGFMRILNNPWEAGAGVKGEYGWDGWTGNYFCNDPENDLTFLYFIQVGGTNGPRPIRTLKQAVYSEVL